MFRVLVMGRNMRKVLLTVGILVGVLSTGALAGPVTDEEKQYCAHDYRQYCGEDGLGSNLLRDCMNKHGKNLSEQCIKALVDAGEVTEAEVERREKAGQ
jgi:hypothetical protein